MKGRFLKRDYSNLTPTFPDKKGCRLLLKEITVLLPTSPKEAVDEIIIALDEMMIIFSENYDSFPNDDAEIIFSWVKKYWNEILKNTESVDIIMGFIGICGDKTEHLKWLEEERKSISNPDLLKIINDSSDEF